MIFMFLVTGSINFITNVLTSMIWILRKSTYLVSSRHNIISLLDIIQSEIAFYSMLSWLKVFLCFDERDAYNIMARWVKKTSNVFTFRSIELFWIYGFVKEIMSRSSIRKFWKIRHSWNTLSSSQERSFAW